MFNIGKCKLFVWLKLGSQKDNSTEFFKDIKERSVSFNVYFSPFSSFCKEKKNTTQFGASCAIFCSLCSQTGTKIAV